MKVIKKINNNFAIALDNNHEELIIYGKGVGFPAMPYELNNLSKIDRSYYNIDKKNIGLLKEVPEEIILISSQIVDSCRAKLSTKINPNLVFTLADHINFCIKRYKEDIQIVVPLIYELRQNYPTEVAIATDAVQRINHFMNVNLPRTEISGIAMNIVNAEMISGRAKSSKDIESVISNVTRIIENKYGIQVDRSSANYSRYATHVQYLLQRLENREVINTENGKLLKGIKEQFPDEYSISIKIIEYLRQIYETDVSDDEIVYLILHINRLCTREDCAHRNKGEATR